MKYENIEDAIKRLEELINLEGSELGEAWDLLITIRRYSYCFSKDFNLAIEKEIFKQANESHEHFEIVEEETTYSRTEKRLKSKE